MMQIFKVIKGIDDIVKRFFNLVIMMVLEILIKNIYSIYSNTK